MTHRKPEAIKEYKLFEANDIAKYGILSLASKVLSPIEYKVLMYLVWKCAQETPEQFEKVEFSLTELCCFLGYTKDQHRNFSHNRKKLEETIDGLMSKRLVIHDAKQDAFISFVWVQTVAILYRDDYLYIRLNSDLSKFFGQDLQKNFTVVKLKYLNRLYTSAAVILYPFFCRYLHLRAFNYSIRELARLLTGNADYQYKYLKRDYIVPAIESINQNTDLHVSFQEYKYERKVSSLHFCVTKEPALDEVECFLDFNGLSYDEQDLLPYNDNWKNAYDYGMSIQKYIRKAEND